VAQTRVSASVPTRVMCSWTAWIFRGASNANTFTTTLDDDRRSNTSGLRMSCGAYLRNES
jgi:hypothetical protein